MEGPKPPETKGVQIASPEWEGERKHLETLLQNRFNFFLVFAALVVNGVIKLPDTIQCGGLWAAFVVTFLLFMALARTMWLVFLVLAKVERDDTRPYSVIYKEAWLGNANWWLGGAAFVVVVLFLILAIAGSFVTIK